MVVSLCVLFEVLAVVFCIHYLYGEKPRFDPATMIFVIIELCLMNIINFYQLDNSWSMLIYPIVILYCGIRFGFNFRTIFVNMILYLIIVCSLQASMIIVCEILIGHFVEQQQLITNFLLFVIVSLVLRKCNLYKMSKTMQKKDKLIVAAMIVALIAILLFLLNYKKNVGFDIIYYIVFVVSVVLIGIVIVDISKHKVKAKEAEAELRLHKLYEESFQNLISEICARQHEFDNHINTIYSQHFSCHTYEELVKVQREYCNIIVQENHFNKLLNKGNAIILGFLYGKLVEIEKQGINVSYKVAIGELDCGVPIYKIVEILGNLLNNATEELLTHLEDNNLYIGLIENNEQVYIEIRNVVIKIDYCKIQEIFKKGYSSKGNKRGYGLYNVKKICEEHTLIYGVIIILLREKIV